MNLINNKPVPVNPTITESNSNLACFIGFFKDLIDKIVNLAKRIFSFVGLALSFPVGTGLKADQPVDVALVIKAANQLMDYFEENLTNFSQQGIFRRSANIQRTNLLIEKLLKSSSFDIQEFNPSADEMACVLKKLMKDMNVFKGQLEALNQAIEVVKNPKKLDLNALKEAINQIPQDKRLFLKRLTSILDRVIQHKKVNLMDAYNLSVVVGPNLYLVDIVTLEDREKISSINNLMEAILTHCNYLFDEKF